MVPDRGLEWGRCREKQSCAGCGLAFILCKCFALLFLQHYLVVLIKPIHVHMLLRTANKNDQRCMKMKYMYDVYMGTPTGDQVYAISLGL